jgi:hypothetical protein
MVEVHYSSGHSSPNFSGDFMKKIFMVVVVLCLSSAFVGAADEPGRLTLDIGNAFVFGKISYEDATIEGDSGAFNPRAALEYKFGGLPLAIGGEYMSSDSDFTGEYDEGDGDTGRGSLSIENDEFTIYMKFVPWYNFNLRLGYRNFSYDITDAHIDRYKNGQLYKTYASGSTHATLDTGIDAQAVLILGSRDFINLGILVGYTYFIDGEYEWEYNESLSGRTRHYSGRATANAHSVRIRPELSVPLSENLRLYANIEAAATAWDADVPDDDPEFPGYDFFVGATVGLRYGFDMF